jgi:hypothetical protein
MTTPKGHIPMATATLPETPAYDRPIELDIAPSDAPRTVRREESGPLATLPTMQRFDAAPTVAALESVVSEVMSGPVGKLPKEHTTRTALRAAYQARLGVLVALWWGAWLKLWEGVGNAADRAAYTAATSLASLDASKRQAIPLPTAAQVAAVDATPVAADPLASALGGIAAETATAAARVTHSYGGIRAQVGAAASATTRGQAREAIRTGGLVTVAADALGGVVSGVGLAWDGHGELTHDQILGALATAGLPADWAPPLPSQRSILGLVMSDENRSGRVARPEHGVSQRSRRVTVGGLPASYKVRWSVMTPAHGQVGDAAGSIAATVTLLTDDTIMCEGDGEICRRVNAEYTRRLLGSSVVYEAGQVTEWLVTLLRTRLGAIRYLGWYVPARHADLATRLVAAVAATGWGNFPANPPMPMITCNALAVGLTRGLDAEVDDVIGELATKRFEARRQKRVEISAGVAATLLVKVRDLIERTSRVKDVIGGEHITALRTRLVAVASEIEPIASDMADGISVVRFANLELV